MIAAMRQKGNNMKKITWIALVLVMAMMLCACGGGTENTNPTGTIGGKDDVSVTPAGYLFTYNDVQFGVDMAMEGVLAKLGQPDDKYTSASCAFGGEDTVYYYSSIQISTNNELGYERIYSIYLEDDLVSTEKGISVGATADAVKEAYGEPGASSADTVMIYEKDGMALSFNLKDGVVSSIRYDDK